MNTSALYSATNNTISDALDRQRIANLFQDNENSSDEVELPTVNEVGQVIFCAGSIERDLQFQAWARYTQNQRGNIPQNNMPNQAINVNNTVQCSSTPFNFSQPHLNANNHQNNNNNNANFRNPNVNSNGQHPFSNITAQLHPSYLPSANIRSNLTRAPNLLQNNVSTSNAKEAQPAYGGLKGRVLRTFKPGITQTVDNVKEALGGDDKPDSIRSAMETLRSNGKLTREKINKLYHYSLVNFQNVSDQNQINNINSFQNNLTSQAQTNPSIQNVAHKNVQNSNMSIQFISYNPSADKTRKVNKAPSPPTSNSLVKEVNKTIRAPGELQTQILSMFTPGKQLSGVDIHPLLGGKDHYTTVTKALDRLVEKGELTSDMVGRNRVYWKVESKKRSLEANTFQMENYSNQNQYNSLQAEQPLNNNNSGTQDLKNSNNNNNKNSLFENNFTHATVNKPIYNGDFENSDSSTVSDNIQIPLSPFVNGSLDSDLIPNVQTPSFENLNHDSESEDPTRLFWG